MTLLAVCVGSVERYEEEEEEDEGWPRLSVVKALLVHVHNTERNCSLTMLNQKYPVKYPDGRGSSHQLVVGCLPTTEADLNNNKYLWQVQGVSSEVRLSASPLTNFYPYRLTTIRTHWKYCGMVRPSSL